MNQRDAVDDEDPDDGDGGDGGAGWRSLGSGAHDNMVLRGYVGACAVDTVSQKTGCKGEGGRQQQTYINKQVLPQAPSPTMTSFRRISAMACELIEKW